MKKYNHTFRGKHSRRGSVIVETAMCVVFLLIPLMLGIIQFGIAYSARNTLAQLTREGGRYLAVWGTTATGKTDDDITTHIVAMKANTILKNCNVTVSYDPADRNGRSQYTPATVTVTANTRNLFFLPIYRVSRMRDTSTVMIER